MNDERFFVGGFEGVEPERYEMRESPRYHFELDRREFFKFAGAGLLVVGIATRIPLGQAQEREAASPLTNTSALPKQVSAWLHVGEDGAVKAFTGKVEIGQNSRTSLTQSLAEELHVPLERVELVMGDTQLCPFDYGTVGSMSVRVMGLQLRRVAMAAREAILELAAEKWQADAGKLQASDGKVIDPATNRSAGYGELVAGRELSKTISTDEHLAKASDWKVAGKPMGKLGGRDFVTGRHKYPYDHKVPGMLYGKVVRPTAFDATLASCDTSAAEQMAGVTVVHDGDFLGVAAPTPELATRAAASIKAEWKAPAAISNKELFDYIKAHPAHDDNTPQGPPGDAVTFQDGSMKDGLAAAGHELQQTYTVQYIAHTPMEPRVAVAQWDDDKLTVWTGTQRPFPVQRQLSGAFHMPVEKIRVIMLDMGAGYGGKHTMDAAVEAARLARAAKRPVKVAWTRQEEFTWAYFRPAGLFEVHSGMTHEGVITAWEFHNYNSGTRALRPPYEIPNQLVQFHPAKYPLRQGSYRGLAATANHFARETHIDELAHEGGIDPLELRLKNIKDERLKNVLHAAADKFGWGQRKPAPGHGFGIACGAEPGMYIATCAEVSADKATGAVKVLRIVAAYECGAIVNPNGLRHQVQGAQMMGLGGALFEQIDFADGRILNARMAKYRVPRFSDMPEIEVVLLDRPDLPSGGAGETPMYGVAPAVGNAIFHATGIRLRSMPLVRNGLKSS